MVGYKSALRDCFKFKRNEPETKETVGSFQAAVLLPVLLPVNVFILFKSPTGDVVLVFNVLNDNV